MTHTAQTPSDPTSQTPSPWLKVMPGVFVLLWSTGFIGAKYGLPYAGPLTFLLLRFIAVTSLLCCLAVALRSEWPTDRTEIGRIALVGVLVHGCYLGGVFVAISLGIPAGVAALLASLQPLLTAALSGWYLGERVRPLQWLGLLIGFIGVAFVVEDKLSFSSNDLYGVAGTAVAVIGITLGTLYQKKHLVHVNLITGSAIQFGAVGVIFFFLAMIFETMSVDWTGEFVFALSWLTVVLSIGAISLFYWMIRHGAAAKVASLFYLVPAITSLIAFGLFGETLGLSAIFGMVLASLGVFLVTKS